jgi:hypothetical protein
MCVLSFDTYFSKGNNIWKQDDLIYLYLLTLSLDVVSVIEKQEEKVRTMLTYGA